MEPVQIADQIFKANQAVWDKVFSAKYDEDTEEAVDEGENTLNAPVATEKTPVELPVEDPKAPPVAAPTAAIGTTKEPGTAATPTDTVTTTAAPGSNAEIGNIIADLMMAKDSGGGMGGIKNEKVMELLAEKGIQTRAADEDKLRKGFEILDKNGNVVAKMVDNNGDGAVGMEDETVVKALHDLGVDDAKMHQLMDLRKEHYAKQGAEKGARKAATIDKNYEKATGGAPAASGATSGTDAAPTGEKGGKVEAGKTEASLAVDPSASIGEKIRSGEDQLNQKGESYKYQVKDTNLNSCPRGKPACVGCGQCMKTELFKIQKQGGSIEGANKPVGGDEGNKTGAATTVTGPTNTVQQPVVEQQTVQQPDVPKSPKLNVKAKPEAAEEQSAEELLKEVQAHLDSAGFADKTAEELLADGQLEQVAMQLGIKLPDNINK
jgi:hypothetical protein